mmetsp:Transcript_11077/g.10607  ORF Transcript_11077/g.10607 Transcript_11077/m.10607 type:complete len:181 (-) Transcript_11077:68-610(-)
MESLRLGMDDARKTATVAKAFRRSLTSAKTSKEDAVRLLTSKLEASKLLQKVTRPSLDDHRSSLSDSVPDFKSLLNECKPKESMPPTIISSTRSSSTQRHVKTKSALRAAACIAKAQRKRQLSLDEKTDDVDAAVKKKASLKDHNNSDRSLSPSPGMTRKRSSPDHQAQPTMKFSRCDSV